MMTNNTTIINSVSSTKHLYDDGIGMVQLVDSMGSDLTIVNAARVSFGNNKIELDDKDKKLINYLIKHNHTSPFEHCTISFKFVVPLFVRSQHHRHRTWSFNEISRRYTDVNINFYAPEKFRTQHKSNRQASNINELINPLIKTSILPSTAQRAVQEHHKKSLILFNNLIDVGVCREQARGVLPQNLYTEYYGTTNLLNLLKFISLRLHEGAQWEIQKVACACLEFLNELFPYTVEAFKSNNFFKF